MLLFEMGRYGITYRLYLCIGKFVKERKTKQAIGETVAVRQVPSVVPGGIIRGVVQ